MFSKFAIWGVVVLVLFMLFKEFDTHSLTGGDVRPVAYSEFLDMVKNKQVKDVILEGTSTAYATNTTDGKKIKTTLTILDRGLIGQLVDSGVKFDNKAPEERGFLSE